MLWVLGMNIKLYFGFELEEDRDCVEERGEGKVIVYRMLRHEGRGPLGA